MRMPKPHQRAAKSVDTLIIIPNQNLFVSPMKDHFRRCFRDGRSGTLFGRCLHHRSDVKEGLSTLFRRRRAIMREMARP